MTSKITKKHRTPAGAQKVKSAPAEEFQESDTAVQVDFLAADSELSVSAAKTKTTKASKGKAAKTSQGTTAKRSKEKTAKAAKAPKGKSQPASSKASTAASQLQQTSQQRAGDVAYIAIQSNFQSAIQRRSAVLADRDPEDLHQMRVSLRRLRTAIEVFAPMIEWPKQVSDRRIASVAVTLGKVRDLDVLREWFEQYGEQNEPSDAETQVLETLQRHLSKRRKKAMASVDKLLHSPLYEQLTEGLQDWLQKPTYQPASQLPMAMLAPDLLMPLMSQVLLHPGWLVATEVVDGQVVPKTNLSAKALAKLLSRQGDELHRLRKQSKRLRYQVELLQEFLGEGCGDRLQEFKSIQTLLGEFQDEVVLNQILQRDLGEKWPKKLPSLKRHFRTQHQTRWQQWQVLQRCYLDPGFRCELRRQIVG